jgi:hypothetical protein
MYNRAGWFLSFIFLSLLLFSVIFLSRHFTWHPFLVWVLIGAIIIIGALLHFHFSGNIKSYPISAFTEIWRDRKYLDPVLYEEGIKFDMHFIPWDRITKLAVTTIDVRTGTNILVSNKENEIFVMPILDIEGFKAAVARKSEFRIETDFNYPGL